MTLLVSCNVYLFVFLMVPAHGNPGTTLMGKPQRELNLKLVRLDGEPRETFIHRQRDFKKGVAHVSPEKLFADLLKRQARRAMLDVTECPPDTLPAHLARVEALQEIISHVLRHDFAGTPEARPSGAQLLHAVTLHDFAACLQITRVQHRAPAFINGRDRELAEINHKLDVLAGLFAQSSALSSVLDESGVES